MRKLAWFTMRDHTSRRPWRWQFVDEMPPGHEDAGGLTIFKTREVLILASIMAKRRTEIVGHELVHVSGAHVKNEDAILAAAEEQVARNAEPAMMALVAALGGQLPALPEGFAAFRKAARKTR